MAYIQAVFSRPSIRFDSNSNSNNLELGNRLEESVVCESCNGSWSGPREGAIEHCVLCGRCYAAVHHHCMFIATCVAEHNIDAFERFVTGIVQATGFFVLAVLVAGWTRDMTPALVIAVAIFLMASGYGAVHVMSKQYADFEDNDHRKR